MGAFYTRNQFVLFRALFGAYLTVHFFELLPYAGELFTDEGMLSDASLSPTFGKLPNLVELLGRTDGPVERLTGLGPKPLVQLYLLSLAVASCMMAHEIARRTMALYVWFGWAGLLNRNVLISNPGLAYVGFLMLVCAVVPPTDRTGSSPTWKMPRRVFWGSNVLMALGYSVSGFHKLVLSPSWWDGSALYYVLSGPLSRDNILTQLLLSMPSFLRLGTWAALALEMMFLPLGLFVVLRKWYWITMVLMHVGILLTVNFTDLTVGVLFIHLFTFDARWLGTRPFSTLQSLAGRAATLVKEPFLKTR